MSTRWSWALMIMSTGCGTSLVEVTPSQLSRAPTLPESTVHIVNDENESIDVKDAFATGCESEMSPCVLSGSVEGDRHTIDLSAPALHHARIVAIYAEREDGGKRAGKTIGWVLFGLSMGALVFGGMYLLFDAMGNAMRL